MEEEMENNLETSREIEWNFFNWLTKKAEEC